MGYARSNLLLVCLRSEEHNPDPPLNGVLVSSISLPSSKPICPPPPDEGLTWRQVWGLKKRVERQVQYIVAGKDLVMLLLYSTVFKCALQQRLLQVTESVEVLSVGVKFDKGLVFILSQVPFTGCLESLERRPFLPEPVTGSIHSSMVLPR